MSTRRIIEISGPDRVAFLQGIVTQDVTKLAEDKIQFAALLSPQGKILHDMFLVNQPDTILIDTPSLYADTLTKRLTMYKLRAKIAIRDVTGEWALELGDAGLPDPRHTELPRRAYHQSETPSSLVPPPPLHLGIPDSAIDFPPDELVAMDAGYDLLRAISFTKGCYVGQEVTARMHYKNIARKGFFIVEATQPLPADAQLTVGEETVPLRRVEGNLGLVFLKFDIALGTANKSVNNMPVTVRTPPWMGPKIAQYSDAANKQ